MRAENFRASQDVIRLNPDGSAVNPQVFQEHIRGDSQLMAQLLQVNFACEDLLAKFYFLSKLYHVLLK